MFNSESEDQKQQLDAMSEEQQLLFFYDNYLICTRIKMIIISFSYYWYKANAKILIPTSIVLQLCHSLSRYMRWHCVCLTHISNCSSWFSLLVLCINWNCTTTTSSISYLVRQSEIWAEYTNDNEFFLVCSIVTFAQIF